MRLRAFAAAVVLPCFLVVTACGGVAPREVMQSAQGKFNTLVKLENDYAAQPFCGAVGAPAKPACADPAAVVKMADYSTKAQDMLEGGWKAADANPEGGDSVDGILTAVINAVGEFGAIIAGWGLGAPAAP